MAEGKTINTPLLEELFSKFKKEAFRLELLDCYQVPGEWEQFHLYLDGKTRPDDPEYWEYCDNLRRSISSGKSFKRVHVVPKKLTPYLKFEIEWYYLSRLDAGEEIYLIELTQYKRILNEASFWPRDFWLFDNQAVVELTYDSEGHFLRETVIDTPTQIENYVAIKNQLISRSIPLKKFLKKRKFKISR